MSGGTDLPARADVVVVGAGAAGSVVARRAAEAGRDVVLLEAGAVAASRRAGLLDVGPESAVTARHPGELDGDALLLPRGRTLGGSGAVNGGYCAPASPADLAAWGPDWPRRYAAGLARAAERLRPVIVPPDPVADRVAAAFPGRSVPIAQARRLGPRGDRRSARRVTAYDAWDPAGAGVRVHTGVEVRAVRWEGGRPGGRCTGVVLSDGREVAAGEVVLCAGALGTAAILLASGLGPATGHPVGERTEEHPEVLLDLGGEAGSSSSPESPGPTGPALPALLSRVVRLGPGGAEPRHAGPAGADPEGAEVEVRPYSVPLHHVIPGLAPQPHRIGIALMTPRTRGRVAPDGDGGVAVRLDAHRDPADARALADAAGLVCDRLGIDAAQVPSTSQHLSGTARIGEVVDDDGRVLGAAGLRIADASVFPHLPRRGPYYSVLAVAEALAARMVDPGA